MYLCNCHGVTYKKVESIVKDGLRELNEVQQKCSAGKDCGSCMKQLCELISRARQTQKRVED